jgi:molecular chaperone DnaK
MTQDVGVRAAELRSAAAGGQRVLRDDFSELSELLAHDDEGVRADAYHALSTAFDPDRETDRERIEGLLTSDDGYRRLFGVRTLADSDLEGPVGEDGPAVGDLVAPLAALVTEDGPTSAVDDHDTSGSDPPRRFALDALADVAKSHPEAVATVTDEVFTHFESYEDGGRRQALWMATRLTREHTAAVEPHVETIVTTLDGDDLLAERAIDVLGRVAATYPGRVEAHVDAIGAFLHEPEFDASPVLTTLGQVARAYPGAVESYTSHVVSLLPAESSLLTQRAVDFLSLVQAGQTANVDLDRLFSPTATLSADDPEQRYRAGVLHHSLSRAPELDTPTTIRETPAAFRDAVTEAAPELAAALGDPDDRVASRAACALDNVADRDDVATAVEPHVSDLAGMLDGSGGQNATFLLKSLSESDPSVLTPVVADLLSYVEANADSRLTHDVLHALSNVVEVSETAAEEAVSRLEPLLAAGTGETKYILAVIAGAAETAPETTRPLLEAVVTDDQYDLTLAEWTYGLDRIARTLPSLLVPLPDRLLAAVERSDYVTAGRARLAIKVVLAAHPDERSTIYDTLYDRLRHSQRVAELFAELTSDPVLAECLANDGVVDDLALAVRDGGQPAGPAARALRNIAAHEPEAVEPATETLLDYAAESADAGAVEALVELSYDDPTVLNAGVDTLADLVETGDEDVVPHATEAIANVAAVAPVAARPARTALVAATSMSLDAPRQEAIDETREYAARALGAIATVEPTEDGKDGWLTALRDELVGALGDESVADPERVRAAKVLAGMVATNPSLWGPPTTELESAAAADHRHVAREAVRALAYLAASSQGFVDRPPSALADRLDRELGHPDQSTVERWTAVEAIAVLARTDKTISAGTVVSRFESAATPVRREALRAFGHLSDLAARTAVDIFVAEHDRGRLLDVAVEASEGSDASPTPAETYPPWSAYAAPVDGTGESADDRPTERTSADEQQSGTRSQRAPQRGGDVDRDPESTDPSPDGVDTDEPVDDSEQTTEADTSTLAPEQPWEIEATPPGLDLDADDWSIESFVDSGGMANVHRVELDVREPIDSELAVKMPSRSDQTQTDGDFEAFVREAEHWERIDGHDHVVTVVDSGTRPLPWIVMEYMDGGSLAARAPLSPAYALGVIDALVDVLIYAHDRSVVHGDFTPTNVLFSEKGRDGVPKVTDWGMARSLSDETQSSEVGYTPAYAPPELLAEEVSTARDRKLCDIYQLGAVAYYTLTGRPPFEGSTVAVLEKIRSETPTPPSQVRDEVPAAFDEPVLRTLAKEPTDRPPTPFHVRDLFSDL